jgi:hypothetical protein
MANTTATTATAATIATTATIAATATAATTATTIKAPRKFKRSHIVFVVWVITLALMPWLADNYYVRLATFVCMYGALAL